MSSKFYTFLLIITFTLGMASCKPSPQYQRVATIPTGGWKYDFQPEFTFDVEDTAAAYQLFLMIRHTNAYPFSNIWLKLDTRPPGDSVFHSSRVEVTLAAAPGVLANGDEAGRWLGRGSGVMWEHRAPINTIHDPLFFPRKGRYTIRMSQDMRVSPLPEVVQAGLRLENLGRPVK